MNTFILHLQAATQYERIEGVSAWIGEDATGRFGILPGHERMITTLTPGMARFRRKAETWQYLALPDSVLYFVANELFINTRRYLRGDDYQALSMTLESQLLAEERELAQIKRSVHRMDEAMLQRLWKIRRTPYDR